jgi:tRNA nucleotidyltransferase (CCA-adding enzyme)
MKEPFIEPLIILHKLQSQGHEAYFVGGAVRDFLLKREIGDVDIATSAFPNEVIQSFEKTIPVGIEHGTVMVVLENDTYEVTTFRTESGYSDYRRPDKVTFIRSLKEDLRRRDFTINAIAMSSKGEIIDPFNGRNDLIEKRLKTVGNPEDRIAEDPLRMMRAVRFISQMTLTIDSETYDAIKRNASMLTYIAIERITVEFDKLLLGPYCNKALQFIKELNLYHFLPGLFSENIDRLANYDLESLHSLEERWALIFITIEADLPESIMREWKQPKQRIKKVVQIIDTFHILVQDGMTKLLIYEKGINDVLSALYLSNIYKDKPTENGIYEAKELYSSLPIKNRRELSVTGNDILEWSQKPAGKWVSDSLTLVERAVIYEQVKNEKEDIKEWLRCNHRLDQSF